MSINLPVTRYYGSKRKLIGKIWNEIEGLGLNFNSTIDLFGGSGIFSYYAKCKGKQIIYNDLFKFNYYIAMALIESPYPAITENRMLDLLNRVEGRYYNDIISRKYKDIYFLDSENQLIDIVVQNIEHSITDIYEKASAYYVLFQTCLIKRPFNLFHRNNLYLRLNHTKSNFGNKVTWEQSFDNLFRKFANELRSFQFDNGKINVVINNSALSCNHTADLVYIDPPYFDIKGSHTSYHSRYHFLEGLCNYGLIEQNILEEKSNKEIQIGNISEFERKKDFLDELSLLVKKHSHSIIVLSYRSPGFPTQDTLVELVRNFKQNVAAIDLGYYSYALNKNNETKEFLVIGY